MKKVLMILTIPLLFYNCAPTMGYIKAGPSFTSIGGDDTESFETRIGFHLGASANFEVGDQFFIQPEIQYSQQGADYEDNTYSNGKFKLDYINVPVLAKYYVTEDFNIQAGPQIGFLLSAKDEYEFEGESFEEDIDENVSGIDVGANLGLCYNLSDNICIGARYYLGFINLDDEGESYEWTNNGFQFSVGYRFDF